MPPKVTPEVRRQVEYAIFRTTQDYIQEATLAHLDSGIGSPDWIRRLGLRSAWWTVVRNKQGHSYVTAVIRFTDGYEIPCKWRVPYHGTVWGGNEMRLNLNGRVSFTRRLDLCTLTGARAGSGSPGGRARKSSPRSRPDIGRGWANRRAKPGQL